MNITPQKISAAIAQALEETFPGETVYHDIVRRDFARPSSLVVLDKVELDPLSMGMAAVGLRYHYKLTIFTKVDEVHDSHLPELTARALALLALFGRGYLKVEDRALKVQSATAATGGYDAAEVSVVLTLTVDRGEFTPGEMLDIMRALNTRFETKEEET